MVGIWKISTKKENADLEYLQETASLDAGSQALPAGVYTTFRTYDHDRVLLLQYHFERLLTSAKLQSVNVLLDQAQIRISLRQIISGYPGIDLRLRIHWALQEAEPVVYLMAEKFHPIPQELYLNGVSVETIHLARKNPLSKATSFITETVELRAARSANIHEYLLVGDNSEILEGMTSNVFFVKNNTLYTASTGILKGITRQLVLEAAGSLSIPVIDQSLLAKEIHEIDEAFITSASRGVLPVSVIDTKKVGLGIPGPITRKISLAFNQKLQSDLELI
jgi:branched-chain amino acid aminotransferase